MFRIYRARCIVRIEPREIMGAEALRSVDKGKILENAALKELREMFEGRYIRDLGFVIAINLLKVSSEGYIIMGDGATYHEVELEIVAYVPMINEIVEGSISEVSRHGAQIRIGPIEGFIHISQISDEEAYFDPVRGAIVLRQSKRVLQREDVVRARVTSISSTAGHRLPRMSLTMRQPYLGKLEWIEEYKRKRGGK